MSASSIYRVFHNRTAQLAQKHPIIEGDHPWKLPSIKCARCGIVSGEMATIYPWMDLAQLPNRAIYRGNKVCVMSREELGKATDTVRPLLPTGYELPPGTSFGAYRGRHTAGVLEDFHFYREARFVSRQAFELLQSHGALGVGATTASIRGRKAAVVDYVELHLVPRATLAVPMVQNADHRYCSECGFDQRSLPEPLVVEKGSIPPDEQIFQLRERPYVKLATAKFVETVKELKLTGLEFEPVDVNQSAQLGGAHTRTPQSVIILPTRPPTKTRPARSVIILKEIDQAHWLAKAERFHSIHVKSLGSDAEAAFTKTPSATEQSIAAVESTLGQPLPQALRELFLNCTSGLEMSYSWEPDEARREAVEELIDGTTVSGGGTIRLGDLPKHKEDARAWAEETWLAEEPDQQELWLKSLPFLHLDNGDYLALDLRQPADDPPVL
jgi:uncharacterized double-CXXCG motif protein